MSILDHLMSSFFSCSIVHISIRIQKLKSHALHVMYLFSQRFKSYTKGRFRWLGKTDRCVFGVCLWWWELSALPFQAKKDMEVLCNPNSHDLALNNNAENFHTSYLFFFCTLSRFHISHIRPTYGSKINPLHSIKTFMKINVCHNIFCKRLEKNDTLL